jgi:hypothetical protein
MSDPKVLSDEELKEIRARHEGYDDVPRLLASYDALKTENEELRTHRIPHAQADALLAGIMAERDRVKADLDEVLNGLQQWSEPILRKHGRLPEKE